MDLSSPSVYYCSTVHFLVLMYCKRNIEINLPVASRDKGGGRVEVGGAFVMLAEIMGIGCPIREWSNS